MQALHGVHVDTHLAAQDAGVARAKLVDRRAVDDHGALLSVGHTLAVYIVVYAIGKQRHLCRHQRRRIGHAEVHLPTLLRLQRLVAQFVSARALVHAVGRELADVGRTEATCQIELELQSVGHLIGHAHAAAHAVETAPELLEAPTAVGLSIGEGVAVQMTVVHSHAATQTDAAHLPAHRGKHAVVEEPVGGYQKLLSPVERPLPHAVDARREFPSAPLGREVVQVVVDGMEHEVEATLLGMLLVLKLLPAVVLVAQEQPDVALAHHP